MPIDAIGVSAAHLGVVVRIFRKEDVDPSVRVDTDDRDVRILVSAEVDARAIASAEEIVATHPELDVRSLVAEAHVSEEPRRRDERRTARTVRRGWSGGETDSESQDAGEGAHRGVPCERDR